MRFFFDACLSYRIADALRALGEDVVHINGVQDLLDKRKDEEWIPYVTERGWIIITSDLNIQRKPAQNRLLGQHGAGAFFLRDSPARPKKLWDHVECVVRHWRAIKAAAEATPRPFRYALARRGLKREG